MPDENNAVELSTELTMAWLLNPRTRISAEDVPAFLNSMHQTVSVLSDPARRETESEVVYEPAVSVRKSLASPDRLVSMIDGKPYKTLKRHLSSHGLTPELYRQRYGLKNDYPMVAPSYSAARSSAARERGRAVSQERSPR